MLAQGLRVSSGSLATFAAMRHASSRVRRCAAERSSGLVLEIDVRERLPDGVADDEADVHRFEGTKGS